MLKIVLVGVPLLLSIGSGLAWVGWCAIKAIGEDQEAARSEKRIFKTPSL